MDDIVFVENLEGAPDLDQQVNDLLFTQRRRVEVLQISFHQIHLDKYVVVLDPGANVKAVM